MQSLSKVVNRYVQLDMNKSLGISILISQFTSALSGNFTLYPNIYTSTPTCYTNFLLYPPIETSFLVLHSTVEFSGVSFVAGK